MPDDRSVTIRQPATANLLIDSLDRNDTNYPSPFNFSIIKPQAIQNGFFNRIGTTEVVLEWCEPNINNEPTRLNNVIAIDISGTAANTYVGTQTVTLTVGCYTVKEVLDTIVAKLNAVTGTTGATFAVTFTNGIVTLTVTGAVYRIQFNDQAAAGSILANQLEIIQETYTNSKQVRCPDIRPFRYIDFVSQQLTYNQELKDATTNSLVRDVLCRWYFSEDVPTALDAYGFPILMGYKPFVRRRLFSPPKQIRWSNDQTIGNLQFQVYGWVPYIGLTPDVIQTDNEDTNWLMTLQLSEN